MLQIVRIFLRSQPTPRPSPSQEGNSGVRSRMGMVSIPFFRSEVIFFVKGNILKSLFIPLTIRNIIFSRLV
ncbi:hypothetical protein [Okeania sp. SIO2C2]|uniref:hypothetical protein n=1 Tax=Okeania sp. SIO2C2 TaxID=2607787 RepID=UPI00257E70D8|nr:hypothetical protein [Okeania sp. SIO2C2]